MTADQKREGMARPTPREAKTFDVLSEMCDRNLDIRLSPLENVVHLRKVKAGTQVTIGVSGDVVGPIATGKLVGFLLLYDAEQYKAAKTALQAPPPPAEPPTLTDADAERRAGEIVGKASRAFDKREMWWNPRWWMDEISAAIRDARQAAAPPPQPETLAADAIVERIAARFSPGLGHTVGWYQQEWVVAAILGLRGTFALAQPEKVTPEGLRDERDAIIRLREARRWRTHVSAISCNGYCRECKDYMDELERAARSQPSDAPPAKDRG